jgi:Zn-dependent protease
VRVRGIRQRRVLAHVAHVLAQIVRMVHDHLVRAAQAEMVGGKDGVVVVGRPMQGDGAQVAGRKVRVPITERDGRSENYPAMHEDERPPEPRRTGRGIKAAGGIVVALGLLAAKFKTLLAVLFTLKWLVFLPKLLFSFGSIFLSLWVYAWIFGWKFGVVFILQILVHEMGHYVTLRNFGAPVSLPLFIPGLGAFVSSPMTEDPARNAVAALMGPVFGVAAATVCWGYGLFTGEPFWIAAAYVGFFLNLFNLIPAYPFDGGRVAGAIDGRIWLIGAALLVGFVVLTRNYSPFMLLILAFVLISSIPRGIAAWRGQVDPRERIAEPGHRVLMAIGYFGLIAIAIAGAAATISQRTAV